MDESLFYQKLTAALGSKVLGREVLSGRHAVSLEPSALLEALHLLMGDPDLAYDILMDLSGADYSTHPEPHALPLCVSYQLYSTKHNQRAWLKVYLPMENPEV